MSLAKLLLSPLALALLALGGCCCCPPLSGRYSEIGQAPHSASDACGCGGNGGGLGHVPLVAGLHHGSGGLGNKGLNLAPSQQHADYVSPLARFHPVPTRPVFEPLPAYHPPVLLDPLPTRQWIAESGKLSVANAP